MSDAPPRDRYVLRMKRAFKAPPQAIFDAWTSSEVLRRWWPAGSDWDTPVVEVDVRVGGSFGSSCVVQTAQSSAAGGNRSRLRRPSALVFTWTWDGDEEPKAPRSSRSDFNEMPDGTTTVVLTNSGLRDEESKRSHEEGWRASFDNLDRVLAP
jgi:uncharacterized protein YndB with AHSA1/START domain